MAPPLQTEVKVLTLNCWFMIFHNFLDRKRHPTRVKALADRLTDYDIVGLQEVWTETDFELVAEVVKDSLPHRHYFRCGMGGAGIAIFSRYPITDFLQRRYTVNGKAEKFLHGDWYGCKAIGVAKILHPRGSIRFFTTHLIAEYNRANDEYLAHRMAQSYEAYKFVNAMAQDADFVIVTGDFNLEPQDLGVRLIRVGADLVDAWEIAGVEGEEGGNTCDCPLNTFSKRKLGDKMQPSDEWNGKRIDYIMFRQVPGIRCTHAEVVCKEIGPDNRSVTDHFGVTASFTLGQGDPNSPPLDSSSSPANQNQLKSMLEEVDSLVRAAVFESSHRRRWQLGRGAAATAFCGFLYVTAAFGNPEAFWMLAQGLVMFIVGVYAFGITYIALYTVTDETNGLKQLLGEVQCSLRAVGGANRTFVNSPTGGLV